MRVLVVHNKYSSRVPSGENLAVDDEMAWLQAAGVDVVPHVSSNDKVFAGDPVQKARQAAEAVWSVSEQRRLERAIDRNQPDVVHLHNLFPLLSASVPWRAVRRDVPVVWTVHNNRIACVGGNNFRDGALCHSCTRGWRVPGIRHACYGGSALASALVTVSSSLFAGIARRRVTAVAISGAMRDWLVATEGFAPDRVKVKYNGVARPDKDLDLARPASSRVFLYAGIVAEHKGVRLLLDAWRAADLPDGAELRFAGDGPLADEVRAAAERDPRISCLGHLSPDDVRAQMATARAVVVPSIWEEGFGRVAAEALACGRPVVTTGLGGLREVVDDQTGWVTGTDASALAGALSTAATADAGVDDRGAAAQLRHDELFSPEATTRALLTIYEGAIG